MMRCVVFFVHMLHSCAIINLSWSKIISFNNIRGISTAGNSGSFYGLQPTGTLYLALLIFVSQLQNQTYSMGVSSLSIETCNENFVFTTKKTRREGGGREVEHGRSCGECRGSGFCMEVWFGSMVVDAMNERRKNLADAFVFSCVCQVNTKS